MQFGPKTVLRHFSPKGHQPQSSTAPAVMFGASTMVRLTDRQAWRKEEYFSLLLARGISDHLKPIDILVELCQQLIDICRLTAAATGTAHISKAPLRPRFAG